jgi:pyrimidine operon attenuation protein / uracil phosphoribosyltransferase
MTTATTQAARVVMDGSAVAAALGRVARKIAARHPDGAALALVGVRRGGIPLAARLHALLVDAGRAGVLVGTVDITLYRDDAATALPNPQIGRSEIPFEVEGRVVILVDDVLYTGRTARAAIDAVMDYGRPRAIELAVLVDRGHRELPIQADYVGLRVETSRRERVEVRVDPGDASHAVVEVLGAAENTPTHGG